MVDGLLLDFKSTRHPHVFRKDVAWQLLGYLLLYTRDRFRIDTLGLYFTRSGVLATWPVEEYVDLLGACRPPRCPRPTTRRLPGRRRPV
ncbi:hypothetical protein ACIHCQ_39900 [Streptomyces sp. NPDC052236]|uniref:hypothetical protein n=1 Tax=Streptomyces sp. NPDC052236 TaxID=3365686 RepID=UPI0037D052D9